MDNRERRVAEKNEKDRLEEILREKERVAARNEPSATPMPSIHGDEWTPSETDVEPDLRDKLNETKRIRPCDCEGEGPDLREAMIKRRVEKAKVPRSPSPDPEGEIGTLYYGPDTAETGGDCLPGFYCRCCEPNKHFMVQDDLRTHEQEPDSSQSQSQAEDDKEEGELENLSPHTQTTQQEPIIDQGECSSSSGEETQVYRVTPFSDEPFNYNRLGPQDCHQSPSPEPWPRQWQRHSPREARDGTLTPPSPLYLSDSAGQEHVTSTTDHRENSEPAPEDWEQTPLPLPDWEIAPLPPRKQ